jgi:hypothetical protein
MITPPASLIFVPVRRKPPRSCGQLFDGDMKTAGSVPKSL